MPETYQLQVYHISGSIKLQSPYDESGDSSGPNETSPSKNVKQTLLDYLNENSPKMTQEISNSMRKMLPPHAHYTIETEISFFEGSFIIVGSMVLAATWSFLQPILEESAKKALGTAFEKGFGKLIESVVTGTVSRWLPKFRSDRGGTPLLPQMAEPMQVKADLVTNISSGPTSNEPPQPAPSQSAASQSTPAQLSIPLYLRILILADTLLLLIIIIVALIPHIKISP